jgi:hypothetical protein
MKRIFNKKIDKRGNKDWRKRWQGSDKSANADSSCRHGGDCDYCRNRRLFRGKRQVKNTEDQLED